VRCDARRRTLLLMAGWVPAATLAQSQVRARLARVGFLTHGPSDAASWLFEPVRNGLREQGWVEGTNLVMEYRYADRQAERLEMLARELVAAPVDVIVAMQTASAHAAKKTTASIPIVFATSDTQGLVANLGRPEGNLTGVSNSGVTIVGKQLEIVKAIVPSGTRVVALVNPANPSTPAFGQAAQSAARQVGLSVVLVAQRDLVEVERLVRAMTPRPDALLVQNDAYIFSELQRIVALAWTLRLPAVYGAREFPLAGGLASYGASLPAVYAQLASYIDRILRGARPADLPVTEPAKFELVVNARTARALGVALPPSLLLRTDERIE